MANTVNILSYNNTFGDLITQQNKAAVELNDIGANNYTKNTGTLILSGSGVGLTVSNTAVLGATIVSGNTSLLGDVTVAANIAITGTGFAFTVSNNAVIAKTLITDSITANSLVRTAIINASGTAFVNGITANTLIRTSTLNSNGPAYLDSVFANTVVYSPIFNSSTIAFFNDLTANNLITTTSLTTTSLTATGSINSPTITGSITSTGVSTSSTPHSNTSNTQIATTGFVKNVLNSGNTFDIIVSNLATTSNVQIYSLGVGTSASATAGEIRATNNITAYYSDDRLKTRLGNIENALAKVMSLNGFQYEANETAQALGYTVKPEIGLSAQEVQAVLPEVVVPAPIDAQYLTVHYERVIPLLVEAIKELKKEVDELKK